MSVACGYLAVLLGYLCLDPPAQKRIETRSPGKAMQSLIQSIQEFISMYKNVDTKVHELEGLVTELRHQQRLYGRR